MRRFVATLSLLVFSAAVSPAVNAQQITIGSQVNELTVHSESGPVTISPKKYAATLVIFVSNYCPVSMAYNGRMNALRKDYSEKNVNVVFVNPNINETNEDTKSLADTTKLGGTVYRDIDNKLADQLNASFTPEAYVFDSAGVLRYHGAIDDSQTESRIKKRPLREALDAVLSGKEVETSITRAFGCTIKRKKA
jgi:thiol-disulfide isomerase/thioredoxin